jgi:hypothetical protein
VWGVWRIGDKITLAGENADSLRFLLTAGQLSIDLRGSRDAKIGRITKNLAVLFGQLLWFLGKRRCTTCRVARKAPVFASIFWCSTHPHVIFLFRGT